MDSFNQPGLWDLSLPPSLPALADDDFIALLQKQFGINNGFPVPLNDTFTKDISALPSGNGMAPPQTANIDPKTLSRVPLPRSAVSPDSPPSDDSSPSPSNAANEPSGSRSRRQSTIYGIDDDDDGQDDDPTHKRKASEEDLDDEPTHKSQHTNASAAAAAKKASRRKSTGNPNADDSRLQKRKEQNRAAQRAFRERKEKHVKDLEDQVAALEQKNVAASQENESLREVVSRLQSENMRLRQSSFTFSVPHSASPNATSATTVNGAPQMHNQKQNQNQMGTFNSPPSTTTSSTASTHDSPQSLFANDKDMETSNDPLSFLNGNLAMLTSMDGNGNVSDHASQTATSDAMNMDFGFGPVNTATPYTTIASNPLFMSFREPDAFDPMASLHHRDRAASSASSSTKPVQSPFDFSSPSSSSGQVPQINNGVNINGNGGIQNWQDISMGDMQAFDLTLSNTLDELFGNAYGSNTTTSTQPAPNSNPNNFDFLTGVGFPSLGRTGSGSSPSIASISPINHHVSPPLSQAGSNVSSINSTMGNPCDPGKRCTKEQMRQYVAADTGSVFAQSNSSSSVNGDGSPNPASMSDSPENGTKNGRPSAEQMAMGEKSDCGDDGDCNEFPRCKGLQLPKTTRSDKNVEVMRAWRTIRQDPNFKDIDINELCSEFASKAKCDGCQVVIDPEGMQEIIEAAQRQRRRKQHSELFRTSEMVLAEADQMGIEAAK